MTLNLKQAVILGIGLGFGFAISALAIGTLKKL